jgi:hypothetical protein
VPRESSVIPSEATDVPTGTTSLTGADGEGSGAEQDAGATVTLSFIASDWQGAYFQQTGNLQPWTAVYAQSTGYGAASLSFNVDGPPATETFSLSVDGMTSENWSELPIALLINGQEVFRGASPFPTWNGVDGQQPWTTVSVELPAALLAPGANTITVVNLVEEGDFSRPPYVLLAGGTVTIALGSGQ